MAFVNIDNRYSSALAMVAGVMITITRLLIPQFYPSQSVNGWTTLFTDLSGAGLKPFSFLAGALSLLVEFGGVSIFIGGLLCFRNHLRSGKEFVGIGATFGFADLLLALPSLASSDSGPVYLAVVAWMGLLFAVLANRHIKGPKRTYAGEVRWFMSNLGRKLSREDERRRGRLRRRRARSFSR
jgi:peptidoglycan/LPS O-acetylase OafA/YrhL